MKTPPAAAEFFRRPGAFCVLLVIGLNEILQKFRVPLAAKFIVPFKIQFPLHGGHPLLADFSLL